MIFLICDRCEGGFCNLKESKGFELSNIPFDVNIPTNFTFVVLFLITAFLHNLHTIYTWDNFLDADVTFNKRPNKKRRVSTTRQVYLKASAPSANPKPTLSSGGRALI